MPRALQGSDDAKNHGFWQTCRMRGSPRQAQAPADEAETEETPGHQPPATSGEMTLEKPREVGGPEGPEPTRFGDWERAGRCIDF